VTDVRTRFAPSPTGYLHIGGARTALFNYLLARRLGGKFVLRIEDTDQTRNIAGAAEKLMEDLRWLGLHWDEGPQVGGEFGPYRQSERVERYRQAAGRLLDEGKAYYAMETREELEAMRAAAMKQTGGFRYRRPANPPSEAQARRAREEGRPVVVRLAMPERDFVVNDQILGDVQIGADELSDFVLLKADGWPTYHFAVVVDDEDMRCTHVLRGQEHLMNTPNHLALQEALGYRRPVYAHLPIILNTDGSKMSKREKDKAVRTALSAALKSNQIDEARARELAGVDGDAFDGWRAGETQLPADGLERLAREIAVVVPEIDIHDFRKSGYLPEVIVNFIALLGWSPGDGREKMTLHEMAAAFSLDRIGRTNAKFDRAKLLSFNLDACTAASAERNLEGLKDFVAVNADTPLRGLDDGVLRELIRSCAGFRTYRDIEYKAGALFVPDDRLRYDADAVRKNLLKSDGTGLKVLREIVSRLAQQQDWSAAALDALVRDFAERSGVGLGKVAQPLRVALTGSTVSPTISDTLHLLGRERTLSRIERALRAADSFSSGQGAAPR
jgi:glutamyl-tRNA synthetase